MAEQVTNDILAVIPDANPDWVFQQVLLQLSTDPVAYHAQARILDSAFSHGYVKLDQPPKPALNPHVPPPPIKSALKTNAVGKRKAPDENPGPSTHTPKKQAVPTRFDYTQLNRPHLAMNASYRDLSFKYLSAQLGNLPVHHIRHRFNQIGRLVPAYLALHREMISGTATCELLKKRRHSMGPYEGPYNSSPLFTAEKKALDAFIASGGANTALLRSASPPPGHVPAPAAANVPVAGPSSARKSVAPARPAAPPTRAARPLPPKQPLARRSQPVAPPKRPDAPPVPVESNEMECGCCFGDTDIAEMIQCAEGHLFCSTCVKRHAETAVGDRKSEILCMDQSGCRAPFTDNQLYRILPANTLGLLDRLRQAKELEAADLGGLEDCPFCDFACIIVDDAPTFLCQKPTCRIESCRKCRRKNHTPKTCAEIDYEENGSKEEHEVAEAMTRALVRDCPQCKTPFMKEAGQPDAYLAPANGRCRLWDIDRAGRAGGSPTRAHNEEVTRAEREARARLAAAASSENPRIPAPQFHYA